MPSQDTLKWMWVAFAFAVQTLLAADFVARLRRPALEREWGWIVYAMGIPALALGLLNLAMGGPPLVTAGLLLFAGWAGLGWTVDRWQRIPWRSPPRWRIFIPYVSLLVASLLAFWIQLWDVGPGYWIAFGVLYTAHTALNLASHRTRGQDPRANVYRAEQEGGRL